VNWQEVSIGSLGRVVTGKTPPTGNRAFYDGEYPFVTPTDLDWQSYVVRSTHSSVTELARDKNKNQFIPANSTVFTCIGNTIGKCGLSAVDCLTNQQINSVVPSDEHEPKFVYYLLNYHRPKIRSLGLGNGAAQPIINKTTFSGVKVVVPASRDDEKRIAAILSAYDDLIENNRRRIALLEEAARQLYKEWFVRFRFPGHEHVKIIDGVPEGWEKKPFSEIADVVRGRSYTSAELRDEGGRAFVNLKCIDRFGGFRDSGIKGIEGDFKEKHMLVPGDIVMAVTDMTRDAMIVAQSGRVSKTVESGAIFSMDLVKIVPKPEIQRDWLYSLLRFSRFAFDVREHANGTNVLHLKPKHIEDWKGVVPPQNVREWFVEAVQVMFDQIDNLQLQSRNATKARDLLLPKLMSGAIAV
jgi:type I restriction enzyme S subunit